MKTEENEIKNYYLKEFSLFDGEYTKDKNTKMSGWIILLIILYLGVLAINLIFSFSLYTVIYYLFCASIITLPSILFLKIGRMLPKSKFDSTKRRFLITTPKQMICKITNVKKWKDKVLVAGDVLDKVDNPHDINFLDTFIFESCFSDWLHTTLCFWGITSVFVIWFISPSLVLPFALPIALIFIFQNMSSIIIQWYTRPRILKLKELLLKRQEREKNKAEKKDEI